MDVKNSNMKNEQHISQGSQAKLQRKGNASVDF